MHRTHQGTAAVSAGGVMTDVLPTFAKVKDFVAKTCSRISDKLREFDYVES